MSEQKSVEAAVRPTDVEYGSFYFRHDCGIPYERNDHWLNFFGKIADAIVRDLRPTSVLDAGCAMGFLVEALRKRGVEAFGVDISEYAISKVDDSVKEFCEVRSLSEPLPRSYDLVVSIEVLEHIPASEAPLVIDNLTTATGRILLSTTPDDYAEATHLNVQPPEVWSAAFAREGFFRDVDHDVSYVTPWAGLFTKSDLPLPELIRDYDRSWARARREAGQLRTSLLSTQEQLEERDRLLAEISAQTEQITVTTEELERGQQELDREHKEVLRLRDLLIGKELELGDATGQLAVIEDRAQRMEAVKQRITGKVPGSGFLIGLLARFLRGR